MSFGNIRDQIAIVGVGTSRFGRNTGRSAIAHCVEAFRDALDDGGLGRDQINGLICVGGVDYDQFAELMNLDITYSAQYWAHGRFVSTAIGQAGMACIAGLADYVVCINGISFSPGEQWGGVDDDEGEREGGGPHGEMPAYGYTHPGSGSAIAYRAYLNQYGIENGDRLGPLAKALRHHASLNPNAVSTRPITLADYAGSPMIIDPLRRLDFCQVNDGAVCVIVSTRARAKDCRKPPVVVAGLQGLGAGRNRWAMARPGLPVAQQQTRAKPDFRDHLVYRMAGIGPADVQSVQIYDSFLPMAIFAMEEMGYCAPGGALDFIAGGRVELGGQLPVNTSGGHHSEGMLGGWAHQVEAVRQLRGECGARQVEGATHIHYFGNACSSVLYRRL